MKIIVSICALLFCYGCAMPNYPSVCDTAPPESVLCRVSNEMGVKLEDIDLFLQITSLRLLDKKGKRVVLDFYDAMETALHANITYAGLVTYAQDKIKLSAPEILIMSRYLPMFSVPQLISDYDRGLIFSHIEHQRAVLQ